MPRLHRQQGIKDEVNPSPKPTKRGWGLLIVCLVTFICGVMFREPVLIEIGVFGGLLIAIAFFLASRNLDRLSVERKVPRYATAGREYTLELTVENRKTLFDSYSFTVEDSLLPFLNKGVYFRWLKARQPSEMKLPSRAVKRGFIRRGSFTVTSSFPLGLFQVTSKRRDPSGMIVFPEPIVPRALEQQLDLTFLEGDETGMASQDLTGDFYGIREFQSGDPVKTIHWPATARAQNLMVLECNRPVPERFSLFYHSFAPEGQLLWPEAFEQGMQFLAGIMERCKRHNLPMDITSYFTKWETYRIDDPSDLIEPMVMLANAEFTPHGEIDELLHALSNVSSGCPIFVISDSPCKNWAHLLPSLNNPITCLDNSAMRIKNKNLNFTRKFD